MTNTTAGTHARVAVAALLGLAVAGCADTGTLPGDPMPAATAEAIALFMVDFDGTAGWAAAAIDERRSGSREFTRTMPCPMGGTRGVNGSGSSSLDPDTRIFSTQWSLTQFHDQCAFSNRRGNTDNLTIIDGSITATGSATYQLPEARTGGRTILSYSSRRVGSTTTTVGERSRTCEIDVTETYHPATGNFHVVGTVCGRAVDIVRTPGASRDG